MIEPRALEAALSAEGQITPTQVLDLRIGVKYTARGSFRSFDQGQTNSTSFITKQGP